MHVHETSIVHPSLNLPRSTKIGAYTIIGEHVKLGENVTIGPFCSIGIEGISSMDTVIQENSIIRSHTIIYCGVRLGRHTTTGNHVTIRENTLISDNCSIGTLSDLQGDLEIGTFSRLHSNVHIAKGTIIGAYVWIFPYCITTNDPHPPSSIRQSVIIEDYAVICVSSAIMPGIRVGSASLIGAHTKVTADTEPGFLYVGNPSRKVMSTSRIRLQDSSRQSAYPWIKHYRYE